MDRESAGRWVNGHPDAMVSPEHRLTPAYRRLSLFASTLFLIFHFSAAYLCTYLPDDPLYLSVGITGYVWYGCAMSVLGLVGAAKVCFLQTQPQTPAHALQQSHFPHDQN